MSIDAIGAMKRVAGPVASFNGPSALASSAITQAEISTDIMRAEQGREDAFFGEFQSAITKYIADEKQINTLIQDGAQSGSLKELPYMSVIQELTLTHSNHALFFSAIVNKLIAGIKTLMQ